MVNVKKKLNTCLKNRNSFLNKFKNILEEHKDDIPIIKKRKSIISKLTLGLKIIAVIIKKQSL